MIMNHTIRTYSWPAYPPCLMAGETDLEPDLDQIVTCINADGSTQERLVGFLKDGDVYMTRETLGHMFSRQRDASSYIGRTVAQ